MALLLGFSFILVFAGNAFSQNSGRNGGDTYKNVPVYYYDTPPAYNNLSSYKYNDNPNIINNQYAPANYNGYNNAGSTTESSSNIQHLHYYY